MSARGPLETLAIAPQMAPLDHRELPRYVQTEFGRIASALNAYVECYPLWVTLDQSAPQLRPTDDSWDGALNPTWGAIGAIEGWRFEALTPQEARFQFLLPHGYRENLPVRLGVLWAPTDASSGTVRWGVEYAWTNVNEAIPATTTVYAETASGGSVALQSADFTETTGGKAIRSVLSGRIFRDSAHANDTYPSAAGLLAVTLRMRVDSDGSLHETRK